LEEVGWIPRAGLDDVEKRKFFIIQGLELRPLGHPARTQSRFYVKGKVVPMLN
jgi:hypothetical protein